MLVYQSITETRKKRPVIVYNLRAFECVNRSLSDFGVFPYYEPTYKIDTFPYKNPLLSDIIICKNNSS